MRQAVNLGEVRRSIRRLIPCRIDLIAEVKADRADRRGIAQTDAQGVRKIVQICERGRFPREGNVIDVPVHIPAVVKECAANPVAGH